MIANYLDSDPVISADADLLAAIKADLSNMPRLEFQFLGQLKTSFIFE